MSDPNQKNGSFVGKLLKNNMVTGLLIVIPILVTLWVGWWSISVMTDWAILLLQKHRPDLAKWTSITLLFRLITIAFLALIVFLIGLLAKVTVGKHLIRLTQKIFLKLPILSIVYSTCQQIGETVKNQKGGLFKQVVLFEYPRKGSWAIGFITSFNEQDFEVTKYFKNGVYSVFMPTTPNPTSGFLFYIPKEDCILLDMPAGEAMKLIVSGGVVLPNIPEKENEKEEEKEEE
ncbi:MAG: DUF502 domain-containing protein [Lentisphaeria bacterium]|nr:DUF502 domain-containing protein [Lentisphaeria bacterium]